LIELRTPRGIAVAVPEADEEDPSPKFGAEDIAGAAAYYEANGYAIVRRLFPAEHCARVRALWDEEVKPFTGFMYRQTTAMAERGVVNANGWIMNPILNLQSVDPRRFPRFRTYATHDILTYGPLAEVFRRLLGDRPKIVQSMYFEGNSATWEHQDTYYLDSESPGEMAAAWIALEDIEARAGRFFICPRSHLIRLDDHGLYNNVALHHETYIQSVVERIDQDGLTIRAPFLRQGDVLFWNARTIHGSLDSQDEARSRSSITCHAIPSRKRFLKLQTRVLDIATDRVNGVDVYRPKDQALPVNRAILLIEARFPRLFYWLKRQVIVFLVGRKAG
jgi:phytanoyl-CoA hydroxylase